MKKIDIILMLGLVMSFVLNACLNVSATEPAMADYTCYPVFQVNAVEPNILILLDNSGSMNLQAYYGRYKHGTKYYGYFEPYKKYAYYGNEFVRAPKIGAWDGNFLNWLSMRRIDIVRKVIMGGLATSRTGGGNQINIGEDPAQEGRDFLKRYDDIDYVVDKGAFEAKGDSYKIRVKKDISFPDETPNFVDGNIAGVLQKIGAKARWGLEFFNEGTGDKCSGGSIRGTIGANITNLLTSMQNKACDTWTPLAEAYYVAAQYFAQKDVKAGLDYPDNVIPNKNVGQDPYYNGTEFVPCAKSFVILLTDGASTKDSMIPAFLKDFDKDYNDDKGCDESDSSNCDYPDGGTDYLDDVALFARTTDLRSATYGKTELDGEQNLILYTIYAFGDNPKAERLLKDAARNGGFIDKNGNNRPDGDYGDPAKDKLEWDTDDDDNPDTFFSADNGYEMEAKMFAAVNDILKRAASGTAVSVLAASGEGEGNLVRASFRPSVTSGTTDVKWVGYLQSLWIDSHSNFREDSNHNLTLDIGEDKILSYFLDPATGNTKIKRFDVTVDNPYPDQETAPYEVLAPDEINPLWEAGSLLSLRNAADRKIFTYIDKNGNGIVDDGAYDPLDRNGEVIRFHADNSPGIRPFLGVEDDSFWSYLGTKPRDRVTNVIQYIRGTEVAGLRTRMLDGNVWKLGDIVHSTPVSISRAVENFHIIYSDESYQNYYNSTKDRETVVYVGANDGMLHAFTSWKYNSGTKEFTSPNDSQTENIGDEIWAYIPQTMLPHLKWLPSTDYTHVYYVDLKPKVFDAKIVDRDGDGAVDWSTILLCGFNLGGQHIWAEGDFDGVGRSDGVRNFYPGYVCMDVTDPRNPRLLWDRSYTGLQLTMSEPAVVKVKNKWFAVFGSGGSDCDATSSQKGKIYVVDLATGTPYKSGDDDWLFQTAESNAFINTPVSMDKTLNFNTDSIYYGVSYYDANKWKGKLYKIAVPWLDTKGSYDGVDPDNYVDNPLLWKHVPFFNATRPVTAPVALSVDLHDNCWVFVGSGRYLSNADKSNSDDQYMFGIKDPFYNDEHTPEGSYGDNYYHNYDTSLELDISDLFDSDPYVIIEGGAVYAGSAYKGDFDKYLIPLAQGYDGWIRSLLIPKERILTKSAVVGGIVFTTSFVPNSDICGFGGDSYLYNQYYETGTAYYKKVFEEGVSDYKGDDKGMVQILDKIPLGEGMGAAVGVHMGVEGPRVFVQQSTGTIVSKTIKPAFDIKSGIRSWLEK